MRANMINVIVQGVGIKAFVHFVVFSGGCHSLPMLWGNFLVGLSDCSMQSVRIISIS